MLALRRIVAQTAQLDLAVGVLIDLVRGTVGAALGWVLFYAFLAALLVFGITHDEGCNAFELGKQNGVVVALSVVRLAVEYARCLLVIVAHALS